jgi:hypothetical protein
VLSAVQYVAGGKLFCVHPLSYIPYYRVAIVTQRISVCQYSTGMPRVGWYRLQLVRTATVYMSVYRGYRNRVVSDYGLDDRESNTDSFKGFFLYPLCQDRPVSSLLYNGYRVSLPGGKAGPRRDAAHSPPSGAEVGND